MPPYLAALKDQVQVEAVHRFDSVLLNLYRDGRDSMGFHADDEPELGDNPLIASVSLGATRRFELRSKRGKPPPLALALEHGSLLVMASLGGSSERADSSSTGLGLLDSDFFAGRFGAFAAR